MRYSRFVAISDTHGNQIDEPAWKAASEFIKSFKPQHRLHFGDCFNFAALRKGANEEEKRERLAPDVERGVALIKDYKPTVFLRGNHDERLWDLFRGDDEKHARFANSIIAEIQEALGDIPMLEYEKQKGVYEFFDHRIGHGYHAGLYAAMNAARVYGNWMQGHTHTVDAQSAPRFGGAIGRCIGCLCKLSQTYNRAHANTIRQAHGFAYGFEIKGKLAVFQAQKVSDTWIFPTEFKTL